MSVAKLNLIDKEGWKKFLNGVWSLVCDAGYGKKIIDINLMPELKQKLRKIDFSKKSTISSFLKEIPSCSEKDSILLLINKRYELTYKERDNELLNLEEKSQPIKTELIKFL
jgi:hypothetical protein